MASRIVFALFGSLGDLHPALAVALELRQRGHDARVATSAAYRAKVEALGLGFHAVRPDNRDADPEVMARNMRGLEAPHDYYFSVLRESFEDTRHAARAADLIVGHPLALTVRSISELDGIPWVSLALSPITFFSCEDPPILVGAEGLAFLRRLPRPLYRAYFALVKRAIHGMGDRVRAFRAELGLGPGPDPLFEGLSSPHLGLALFSDVLAKPQRDWPARTVVTGFCFHDRDEGGAPPSELTRFLDAGPPPIVFSLGTAVASNPGSFYAEAAEAARILGRRAVLVTGRAPANRPASLPECVIAVDYARFSELFPRALAVVHPGGIGTIALALRAGRPMLMVPHAFDQPDNADRAARAGLGRVVSRRRATAANLARELAALLDDRRVAEGVAKAGEQVRSENGVRAAADAIEALLAGKPDAAAASRAS